MARLEMYYPWQNALPINHSHGRVGLAGAGLAESKAGDSLITSSNQLTAVYAGKNVYIKG